MPRFDDYLAQRDRYEGLPPSRATADGPGTLTPRQGEEYVVDAGGMPLRSMSESLRDAKRARLHRMAGAASRGAALAPRYESGIDPDDTDARRGFEQASLGRMFPRGVPQELQREWDARWEGWADPGTFSSWLDLINQKYGQ